MPPVSVTFTSNQEAAHYIAERISVAMQEVTERLDLSHPDDIAALPAAVTTGPIYLNGLAEDLDGFGLIRRGREESIFGDTPDDPEKFSIEEPVQRTLRYALALSATTHDPRLQAAVGFILENLWKHFNREAPDINTRWQGSGLFAGWAEMKARAGSEQIWSIPERVSAPAPVPAQLPAASMLVVASRPALSSPFDDYEAWTDLLSQAASRILEDTQVRLSEGQAEQLGRLADKSRNVVSVLTMDQLFFPLWEGSQDSHPQVARLIAYVMRVWFHLEAKEALRDSIGVASPETYSLALRVNDYLVRKGYPAGFENGPPREALRETENLLEVPSGVNPTLGAVLAHRLGLVQPIRIDRRTIILRFTHQEISHYLADKPSFMARVLGQPQLQGLDEIVVSIEKGSTASILDWYDFDRSQKSLKARADKTGMSEGEILLRRYFGNVLVANLKVGSDHLFITTTPEALSLLKPLQAQSSALIPQVGSEPMGEVLQIVLNVLFKESHTHHVVFILGSEQVLIFKLHSTSRPPYYVWSSYLPKINDAGLYFLNGDLAPLLTPYFGQWNAHVRWKDTPDRTKYLTVEGDSWEMEAAFSNGEALKKISALFPGGFYVTVRRNGINILKYEKQADGNWKRVNPVSALTRPSDPAPDPTPPAAANVSRRSPFKIRPIASAPVDQAPDGSKDGDKGPTNMLATGGQVLVSSAQLTAPVKMGQLVLAPQGALLPLPQLATHRREDNSYWAKGSEKFLERFTQARDTLSNQTWEGFEGHRLQLLGLMNELIQTHNVRALQAILQKYQELGLAAEEMRIWEAASLVLNGSRSLPQEITAPAQKKVQQPFGTVRVGVNPILGTPQGVMPTTPIQAH